MSFQMANKSRNLISLHYQNAKERKENIMLGTIISLTVLWGPGTVLLSRPH